MTSHDDCEGLHDKKAIGEFAIYPGHPVTLALIIVRTHGSSAEANRDEGHPWPHAVGCLAVPGAGGNVHSAMHLLTRWARGEDLDALFEQADRTWASCDTQKEHDVSRWQEGQAQADRFKPQLVEALKGWPK